ncbi:hypothetical protein [Nodosilinea sp. P-1105]|uniref:hypothetical protein n=1 Tax=Nodosilinea sp. P-1105 TaxID=2546229 RepID=UPI00146C0A90|nr:hypothetical protein [Nodosilinea sp. P-1105]NMF86390.1 hypothetical protein [Nodosilinea sp. P-1105]
MTEASKYNFPKAEKVQVFEQVDTYIETQHNYAHDPSVQAAIADLQTLITHLQTQHPNVATEPDALAILVLAHLRISLQQAEAGDLKPISDLWNSSVHRHQQLIERRN